MEQKNITLRDLYPQLNDEQLAEVEFIWERYLTLMLRIYERLEAQGQLPALNLTANADEIKMRFIGPGIHT